MFQHNWGPRLTKITTESESSVLFQDLGCDLVLWRIGIVNKFLEFWRGFRKGLIHYCAKWKNKKREQKMKKISVFLVWLSVLFNGRGLNRRMSTNYGAKSAFITERE